MKAFASKQTQTTVRYAFHDGARFVVMHGQPCAAMPDGWLWWKREHVNTMDEAVRLVMA